ncbi:MAG TPA: hypothetical protein VNO79_14250 [Actinomycetota bacterium]|nr:hypothetical protein [Actinomycetota bacterium]
MNRALWLALFALNALPITLLLADRILAIPAPRVIRAWGGPALAAFAALVAYGAWVGDPVVDLVGWGLLAGLAATVALDAVRLLGVALRLFPMDMPMMFGIIALGQAPRLQRNAIARLVEHLSRVPEDRRAGMMSARLPAIARLDPARRRAVVSAMMEGLTRLPEEPRRRVMATQMRVLAELPEAVRQTLLRTMDEASGGPDGVPYAQPRGLPGIPMGTFRHLMARALPDTLEQAGLSRARVALWGYGWHVLNGMSFGVMYTMLAGRGSWALAIGWGVFVWLAMMVAMPVMMPAIRFPAWFPIWPLLAHLAMAIPIGAVALAWVGPTTTRTASLLGWLGWVP